MKPSLDDLTRYLSLSGLGESQALHRAKLVYETIEWIKPKCFELRLDSVWIDKRQTDPFPLVEYYLGPNMFDFENAKSWNDKRATSVSGSGLNQYPLRWFSKAIECAKDRIPELWLKSSSIQTYLRRPSEHMGKLNELVWLNRFGCICDVQESFPLKSESDVDWRFRIPLLGGADIWINLEVKFRPRDVCRGVGKRDFPDPDIFMDIKHKFLPGNPGEINVAAITLFGPITPDLRMRAAKWLTADKGVANPVDAVVFWSYEGRQYPDFVCCIREGFDQAEILKAILVGPDEEDRNVIRRYTHAMPREMIPPEFRDAIPFQ